MDISSDAKHKRSSVTEAKMSRMMHATVICQALLNGGDSRDVHSDSDGFIDAYIFNHGTKRYQQYLINPVQANCGCRLAFKYPVAKSRTLLSKMRQIKENWFSITFEDRDADELCPVYIRVDSEETANRIIEQVFDADVRNIEFHPARFALAGDKYRYDGIM